MEHKPKDQKETYMQQQPILIPEYKKEKPISVKEEAIALLDKSIEGNSVNQVEILPNGEVVIAVYVV